MRAALIAGWVFATFLYSQLGLPADPYSQLIAAIPYGLLCVVIGILWARKRGV